MNSQTTKEWLSLSVKTRKEIFEEIALKVGLPYAAAVEKDWWVVRTLELVFESSIAKHTVFKGGTSLSKAWGLIDRFSEDIDLALDRRFLGFDKPDGQMNGSQVSKLRKQSFQFISETLFTEIKNLFVDSGFKDVEVRIGEVKDPDQDPLTIEVYYPCLTNLVDYLPPRVLIEVGSRSLIEPFETRNILSFVGEQYPGRSFADQPIEIPTVLPERTFLEKLFLLHEEFQLPTLKIKVERKSRHLYDVEKMMDRDFALGAISNKDLFQTIVEHRRTLTPLRGVNYANHIPSKINPIPPDSIIDAWEKDYKAMQESMLFNHSLPFSELIDRLLILKSRVNTITF
jgi:hypothetical protein